VVFFSPGFFILFHFARPVVENDNVTNRFTMLEINTKVSFVSFALFLNFYNQNKLLIEEKMFLLPL